MSDVNLSPSTRAKIKTIEAANKIKHGSPKFQEVLRQRCRERIREKRGQLFNGRRLLVESPPDGLQETLTNIVRKEFNDIMSTDWNTNVEAFNNIFNSPLELEEALELEEEIIAEEEQWIEEEYFKELQKEQDHLTQEIVFCPICQKTGMQEIPGFICCSTCNIQFPALMSIQDFQRRVLETAVNHSSKCIQRPNFTAVPINDNIELYLTCESCSSFSPVFDDGPF